MMRVALLLLTVSAVCYGILPDIVDSSISHILGEHHGPGQTELDHTFVEVEQLQEEKLEDGLQVGIFFSLLLLLFIFFLAWQSIFVLFILHSSIRMNLSYII